MKQVVPRVAFSGFGFLVRPKEGPELFGECGIVLVRIVVRSGSV